jgi:hypothetical protein
MPSFSASCICDRLPNSESSRASRYLSGSVGIKFLKQFATQALRFVESLLLSSSTKSNVLFFFAKMIGDRIARDLIDPTGKLLGIF